jgi:hypothetical protein
MCNAQSTIQKKERVKQRRYIKGEHRARKVLKKGKKHFKKQPTGGYGRRGCIAGSLAIKFFN